MLTFDSPLHADKVRELMRAAMPTEYGIYDPDQVPRDAAGLAAPGRYVELLVQRRETQPETLRAGQTSRRPMLITTTSVGTTFRECARLQRFVADALQGSRILLQDSWATPIQLDFADAPDQVTSGVWSAADLWTYTH